jgi:uroporphyrinogen III methyltransferase/synthase
VSRAPSGPLAGKRILVTRAEEGAGGLAALLAAQGAEILHIPLLRFVDPPSWEPLREAAARLESFDRALFTSATAVERFFAHLLEFTGSGRLPAGIRVSAVGPRTAAALERAGCRQVQHAASYQAEGLLELLPESEVAGREILFPRALEARELLLEELRRRGARICLVPVYRTAIASENRDKLLAALATCPEVVTFTSASSVRHFVELVGPAQTASLLRGVKIACLGQVTAQAARDRDINPDIVPPNATLEVLAGEIVRGLGA